MDDDAWILQELSSFIYLLCKRNEARTILQRRFKKDQPALSMLFKTIEKIDELGYEDGVTFAFDSHRMDTIRGHGEYGLIEIRIKDTLWRVIAYWSKAQHLFVILDAFEAHRHKSMDEEVKLVLPRARQAKKLVEEID